MKQFKPILLLLTISAFTALNANANYGHDHTSNCGGHRPKESNKVPLNGGISLLIAAGACFGALKVMPKNKDNTTIS